MITTKRLKERLQSGETLTFIYPGNLTGNARDLVIKVLPTDLLPHEVTVEGIEQYSIPTDSELYYMWFKSPKQRNKWETKFNREWRFLLSLNGPGTLDTNEENSELLYFIQDKVYQFYLRGKWSRRKWKLNWSKGPYNKKNDYVTSHRRFVESAEQHGITRSYVNHKGKLVTRFHKFWVVKYDHTVHNIELEDSQRPDETFRYVMDVCTKAVEKVSLEIAEDLVERFEHYDYCSARDYRYFLIDQKPKRIKPLPNLYWKDVAEEVKIDKTEMVKTIDEKGTVVRAKHTIPVVLRNNFMPKINPKDKIQQDEQMILKAKEHTRVERRNWKHKKKFYDRNAKSQTIKIMPSGDVELEKFKIKQIIFDYEYGPRFTNGQQMFDANGEPLLKKIYVGKREEYVTITESPRTIYKSIVTKQYPGDLSKKRGIIKKNIELLRQYQAEQAKVVEPVKQPLELEEAVKSE